MPCGKIERFVDGKWVFYSFGGPYEMPNTYEYRYVSFI